MNAKEKILIIGSSGQIGSELVESLRDIYGRESVIASDIRDLEKESLEAVAPYEKLNVLNKDHLYALVK
ncbi:MAG: NAD-dependent epimerase, partial [Bacteroidia bacterium]